MRFGHQRPGIIRKHIGVLFQNAGWRIAPPANTQGLIWAATRRHRIAVQVKNYTPQVQPGRCGEIPQFSGAAAGGWVCFMGVFVSASGFSKNALLDVEANQREVQETRQACRRRCAVRRPAHAAPGRRAALPVKWWNTVMAACWAPRWRPKPASRRPIAAISACSPASGGRRGQNHHRRASGWRVCLDGPRCDPAGPRPRPKPAQAVSRRHGQRRQRSQPVCAGADEIQPGATITVLSHAQWQQSLPGIIATLKW